VLDSLVYLNDVLVVRETENGVFCEIDGRPTFLGKLQLALGTKLPPVGERGTIAITRMAAQDLGLVLPALFAHAGLGPRRTRRAPSGT
jgi:hypothetical protein